MFLNSSQELSLTDALTNSNLYVKNYTDKGDNKLEIYVYDLSEYKDIIDPFINGKYSEINKEYVQQNFRRYFISDNTFYYRND